MNDAILTIVKTLCIIQCIRKARYFYIEQNMSACEAWITCGIMITVF